MASLDPANINAIFKAYDVRGTVPDQLDEDLARATGKAYVQVTGATEVVVGYDMRPSSPGMAGAFADGATWAGADVTMIGLASTDQLYFASGHLNMAGAMFTASHNPAQYNGIKMCRALAQPIGLETGLAEIRDLVISGDFATPTRTGSLTEHDVLAAYAAHLLSLAPVSGRKLKVVADAGNGMAGYTAPAVFGRLADQVELVPLYFELDGTFPHHEANPIEAANLVDLQAKVLEERADIGLAFDGDADRCFLVDETGRAVSPSTLTALIAERELAKDPGAAVIHNLITSRAVPELVSELGGTPVRTRVGHSFIKATMAETNAIFGGEHSGHFYFRDFWRADSGMLAALHALAALAGTDQTLSQLLATYERYPLSGEINSTVADQQAALSAIEETFGSRDGVTLDRLDGLTVSHADWQFNVRASNTEPLLRLNAEGKDEETMAAIRDEALALIRTGAGA
ncbi:phosphomannomutase/phosphoglucomutase [Nocardioides sp.]|uniref:phosphomannomutase/phosphoglucomutase n=1 Tax=Nocardioides sp. TaxID=35761 RepID=UPI000C99115D|nr:phosphomannomutase/phosphoglucomutase [Nocardioides sp.]MAS56813.1 phosphomannomutase/phosphoglucomutase [Pimelobacter sp.]MDE0777808.1 phosphomannomutase/phosphoglucomutase [Nocardioides sp.]